jgi:hypothetical protein
VKDNMQIKQTIKKVFHWKVWLIIFLVAVFGTALIFGVNQFFEGNKLVFTRPVQVNFYNPITIEKRQLINIIQVEGGENLPLTENEKYLCMKFGNQCKTALEVQRRENPTGKCDAFYVNKNKTLDFGFMQVNSVHLSPDITIAQLVDCKGNIDIAYEIYKRDGWTAWVAYNNMVK